MPGNLHRRHDRDLAFDQLSRIGMLFKNGGIAPACRTIELCNQRLLVFNTHLVDTILKTVECKQSDHQDANQLDSSASIN